MEHLILTGLCLQPETISPNGGFPMKGVINKSMECPLYPFVHSADGFFLVLFIYFLAVLSLFFMVWAFL